MHTPLFKTLFFALGFGLLAASNPSSSVHQDGAAGDPQVVLQQLEAFYQTHPYVYHELSYTLFADHQTKEPHSLESGIFIQENKVRYAQLASVESLNTPDFALGIDHAEKTIMIAERWSIPANSPLENLQQWAPDPALLSIHPLSPETAALHIKVDYGEVEALEIEYDIKQYQPLKLILKYRQSIQLDPEEDSPFVQPRMEIKYKVSDFKGLEKVRLNLQNYVRKRGETWELAPKYSSYELINNIQAKPF